MTRIEWVLLAALAVIVFLGWLTGCADHRPGDFAPDQIRWIDGNVK